MLLKPYRLTRDSSLAHSGADLEILEGGVNLSKVKLNHKQGGLDE